MCGLSGTVSSRASSFSGMEAFTKAARHRGPDGMGYWCWDGVSASGKSVETEIPGEFFRQKMQVILGHTRLAVLDLSARARQPMVSPDGRVCLIYNGEVYNYRELRRSELTGSFDFQTSSDAEVVLASYLKWGTDCFSRFNGMWAAVIVDLNRKKVIFSRDRFGTKPLYTYFKNESVYFASDLRQFFTLPDFRPELNFDVLAEYIENGYEDPDLSFFTGVNPVPAGHWGQTDLLEPAELEFSRFWNPEAIQIFKPKSFDAAAERLREVFQDSVEFCLRSDRPVGVSLSGGLDSSCVLGQAVELLSKKNLEGPAVYSAYFQEANYSEQIFVQRTLDHWKLQGNSIFPTAESFLKDCDQFLLDLNEPPSSLSQYAAWCVMRLAASRGQKVMLSGEGADEFFSGYWSSYYYYLRSCLFLEPQKVTRHLLGSMFPGGNIQMIAQFFPHYFKRYLNRKKRANRRFIRAEFQSRGLSLNQNPVDEAQSISPEIYRLQDIQRRHLPRLLKWNDRNAMAHGIETRYPFLDTRLTDFALLLPVEMNLRSGWNKSLIRKGLGHLMVPELVWQKSKVGFEAPQAEWVKGVLREPILKSFQESCPNFKSLVDVPQLTAFAKDYLNRRKIGRMDEEHRLIVRLFFLEKWMKLFKIGKITHSG